MSESKYQPPEELKKLEKFSSKMTELLAEYLEERKQQQNQQQ